jgi:hypothetical protein
VHPLFHDHALIAQIAGIPAITEAKKGETYDREKPNPLARSIA